MDTCPRCQSGERVERAAAIVESGAQPLGGILGLPLPPSTPRKITAYRVCIGIGVVGSLSAVGASSNAQTQEEAPSVLFNDLALLFSLSLLVVGIVLMSTSGRLRREWFAARQVHGVIRQLWPLLDYCHRCNVVFLPGGSFATDPVHTSRFLWDAADHTLRTQGQRPPEL